ncbi:MAG: vitamin K epoxide reductase family protein [Thermoplasmata archaeon]
MQTRSIRTLVYTAAGIGLLLSAFAAFEVIDAALTKLCTFNGFFSCATVANSGHTTTLYVPDWLWGLLGFILIIAVASLAERRPRDPRYAYALVGLTTSGSAFSLDFLYVELVVISAICIVCVSAYAMGFLCWGGAIALARAPPPSPGESNENEDEE